MKKVLLALFFSVSANSAYVQAGGDVVNNGGGLSEQALLLSVLHFDDFIESCLRYTSCAGEATGQLQSIKACVRPTVSAFQFSTSKETPELSGIPYLVAHDKKIVVNREKLYSSGTEPLRLPDAFGYITRLFGDYCGTAAFTETEILAENLRNFANFDSEQITVGKDDLSLPKSKWIRVRTLYSDLVIEAGDNAFRLSCPDGTLNQCGIAEPDSKGAKTRFKNLSLVEEKEIDSHIFFLIEGTFVNGGGKSQYFQLKAEFDGKEISAGLTPL